ncbi:LOW QUALITY PROTEIN: exostosin-1c-like [Tetranychus urticae]|uniref:LOW QUALITY PROTEIN: exostosin-1c-like n=1 Tax=Tetranychus urticae TaxID=32264 RepID=UPI000D657BAF|nr:LOW QUALITY PROTEIN: exostosin-1c-like [Tetranychus urticae]
MENKADEQNRMHVNEALKKTKKPEFLADCRMSNCFNFDRCKPGERLKIHIYPDSSKISSSSISSTYQKIIQIIESSIYYEPDESKACLFITGYDYLDRDPLSRDCQKNLPASLPLDYEKNRIVFNLYSGTWPDYRELVGFNLENSILAKASFSYQNYRPGFDLSIPLFSKNHSTRGKTLMEPEDGPEYQLVDDVVIETIDTTRLDSSDRKNLLVFRGKRYTHGIGSETRNTLHHLHNVRDILIYTTCKHGKKWKDLKDERCAKDNLEYEKFNYSILMANSAFWLVPRGKRLGSFRFLEALANGCIPVLLSNNWVKPFEDVIDWSEIVVEGDERSLLQLPEIIRSYEWKKIQQMAAKSLAVYETYFSSVERIVYTTIDILNERIQTHLSFTTFLWILVNPSFTSFTGAIWYDAEYSFDLKDYPGYGKLSNSYSSSRSSPLSSSSASSDSFEL